jgi:hypothetical protein
MHRAPKIIRLRYPATLASVHHTLRNTHCLKSKAVRADTASVVNGLLFLNVKNHGIPLKPLSELRGKFQSSDLNVTGTIATLSAETVRGEWFGLNCRRALR